MSHYDTDPWTTHATIRTWDKVIHRLETRMKHAKGWHHRARLGERIRRAKAQKVAVVLANS